MILWYLTKYIALINIIRKKKDCYYFQFREAIIARVLLLTDY